MLTPAKNYDIICLQMMAHGPHLQSPMKQEMDKLLAKIRVALTSGGKVKPALDDMLPAIFNFRIKALKWLIEEDGLNLARIIDEVYPQLEELRENPKLEVLAENILFALRCNKRVIDSVIGSASINDSNIESGISQMPDINYEQFITSIAFGIPDDATAQKIVDIAHSSLYIEFIILSAAIINDEKLEITDEAINELAFLISDAAQEYSAIATELGILKPRFQDKQSFSVEIDKSFTEEQRYLSEFGLNDFAKNFD